ncbi:MAG: NAD-dependent epimerase/dehydratase family protein [Deltaproteobacteria bacterium]|nr:NAD-dependent epimerase/dehydratase family protein [Deltaproteobacteria bacterium]
MRYLLTGGAGFIGSHLCEALLARGDEVLVLDDFSTGRRANLSAVALHEGLRVVEGSVLDRPRLRSLVRGVGSVLHLASAVGVQKILAERVAGIVTNVDGTEAVLEACAEEGARFFLASTSEVYGKLAAVPFREEDDVVLGPSALHRWSYACSKLLDEFLALAWHQERGLPVTVARFFNVVGPRQRPDFGAVLPRFCAAALAGRDLEVHGSGLQRRCFLHVHDCVRAVLLLLDRREAVGRVVNVGSAEEVTIRALAERVVSLAGSSSALKVRPYAAAFPSGGFEDMQRRVPDTSRLQGLTGWRPTLDLDASIRDALAWARQG